MTARNRNQPQSPPNGGDLYPPADADQQDRALAPVLSAVSDMVTWVEDQLESCGLRGFRDLDDSTRIRGFIEYIGRLGILATVARRDPAVAQLLSAVGFEQVVEIALRTLRSRLAYEPATFWREREFLEMEQLSLEFANSNEPPRPEDDGPRFTRRPAA